MFNVGHEEDIQPKSDIHLQNKESGFILLIPQYKLLRLIAKSWKIFFFFFY